MRACLPVLLLVTSLGATAPAPQTRPWRIAVVGGYATGYLGLLAMHGLPRARLDESDLARPERLRQYDVLITTVRGAWATNEVEADLEKFAAEGGIVIIESVPTLTAETLPGQRLGPATSSNVRFLATPHPISQGLPDLGVLPTYAYTAAAIIPSSPNQATVLAEFTDEGVPDKYKGNFTPGGKGAPAILLVPHGKGTIIYSGTSLGYYLSLRGPQFEKFLFNTLDALSGGQLRDRLYTGDVNNNELVTSTPADPEPAPYPAPREAAGAAPTGFEVLEEAADLQDFRLTGKLPAQGAAQVLVGYWSPGNTDQLSFAGGQLTLQRLQAAKAIRTAKVPLPAPAGAITITRNQGLLTVAQDGQCLYAGAVGPPRQGALASQGLTDTAVQPLAPVHFADDFMREAGDADEWKPVSGPWQVVASEGRVEQGANPFNVQVRADANGAINLTGEAFWSDLRCQVALQTSAEAAGLIVNYQAPDRYHLLRLMVNPTTADASRLQLVQRLPSGEQVLADAPVSAGKADWHRLELRTSRGRLQGWLNRRLVVQATCDPAASGKVGLYGRSGPVACDDVVVEPWLATAPLTGASLDGMTITGGAWQAAGDGMTLNGSGAKGGRLLAPWPAVEDCQAAVRVRPGRSEGAGLVLRSGPAGCLVVTLRADGAGLKLRVARQGESAATLAEKSVTGSASAWHDLTASALGPTIRAGVDGRALLSVVDTTFTGGAPGLSARGAQPAQFRDFQAWQESAETQLTDEPMPSFAGIIDRHTWAGRTGAWLPDPASLNCLWHQGMFPGDVRADIGVYPAAAPTTVTTLSLAPRLQPANGVVLTAQRPWAQGKVALNLTVQGKRLADGDATVASAKPYALGLERVGSDLLVRVNHRVVLHARTAQPHPEWDSLGLDNGGEPIRAQDTAVSSPWVHDSTFETAPTDWVVESGTWKLSNRWSCSPGWSWFAGLDPSGPAMIHTRDRFAGDLEVVTYVAAKMMPSGGGYSERLTDIHLACCTDEGTADTGYHFILGDKANTWTGLMRQGQKVLESAWRIPQTTIHNDWLRLTLRRRGPVVSLSVWDTPILEYNDPAPLPGGRVRMGTFQNGVLIPRVSIFGRPEGRNLLPVLPPPAAAPPDKPASGATLALAPKVLFSFGVDQTTPEFGGEWGLWPQNTDCRGDATIVPGEDAEHGPGGALKVSYTIKAAPQSFSVWMTPASATDVSAYGRVVLYARGDVPSFTLVVKDSSATDPSAPAGIADVVVTGLTSQWKRFEIPFSSFVPRQKTATFNWRALNHVGLAMIAPQNAVSGTFWVDNLRLEAGRK